MNIRITFNQKFLNKENKFAFDEYSICSCSYTKKWNCFIFFNFTSIPIALNTFRITVDAGHRAVPLVTDSASAQVG